MSCEYCHEDKDGCVACIDRRGHLFFKYPNKLVLSFDKSRSNIFCSTFPTCEDAWLAWLRQEVEK